MKRGLAKSVAADAAALAAIAVAVADVAASAAAAVAVAAVAAAAVAVAATATDTKSATSADKFRQGMNGHGSFIPAQRAMQAVEVIKAPISSLLCNTPAITSAAATPATSRHAATKE